MNQSLNERAAASSTAEDAFVELFAQVFGLDKVQLLSYDYAVEDIYGSSRFIDYALRTVDAKVAFEIDGLTWHHPEAITIDKFEDDLLRQNSLIHQGWRVFRWTDRELLTEPEKVKEQLALFLESISDLVSFENFLPKQQGETIELRPHQQEALDALENMRNSGQDDCATDTPLRELEKRSPLSVTPNVLADGHYFLHTDANLSFRRMIRFANCGLNHRPACSWPKFATMMHTTLLLPFKVFPTDFGSLIRQHSII